MIQLNGAGLRLAGRELLDGFSLRLPDAGLYALEGPTGSCKSLLGRMLCGLQRPAHGRVSADGIDIYHPLSFNRPPLWYCDALQEAVAGQTVEEYAQALVYDTGGRQRDMLAWLPQLEQVLGLSRQAELGTLSSGERAALQLTVSGLLPLRLIVLDGQLGLLDAETATACLDLLAEHWSGQSNFILLIARSVTVELPGLQQAWRLAGGLPARLEAGLAPGATGPSAAAVPDGRTVLRVGLTGGRDPRRAYQSGRSYRVLGLLERGIRVELTQDLPTALAEMQADGLALRGIEWE